MKKTRGQKTSHRSATVGCRMSSAVAELVTLRALGSQTVAPKPALKLLTAHRQNPGQAAETRRRPIEAVRVAAEVD